MIDQGAIPECAWMDLARTLQSEVIKFYKDPENKKAYEKWAAERRAQREQATEK